MAHKNSKIVTICRVMSFTHEANNDPETKEWFGQAARDIGSYFQGRYSKIAGSGLTQDEEDLLMPKIVGLKKEHEKFRERVENFFHEISTKVPDNGLSLEIGLISDNDAPVSAENMPLHVENYIKYKHALGHPKVAKSKDEGIGNQLISWYIDNPEDNEDLAKKEAEAKDAAMAIYLSIKEKPETVDRILTNMGVDIRKIKDPVIELRKLAETKSKYFTIVANDKDLETKYRINKLIQTNILELVGTRIIVKESGKEIGRDMKEAMLWYNDPTYSDQVGAMTARYKEFVKKRNVTVED